MKITIERLGGTPVSFEKFAENNGLEMVVRERSSEAPAQCRFYASFKYVEVMDRGFLVGQYGDGETPESAIAAYRDKLRGKRVVYRACSTFDRREFQCPSEWLDA